MMLDPPHCIRITLVTLLLKSTPTIIDTNHISNPLPYSKNYVAASRGKVDVTSTTTPTLTPLEATTPTLTPISQTLEAEA